MGNISQKSNCYCRILPSRCNCTGGNCLWTNHSINGSERWCEGQKNSCSVLNGRWTFLFWLKSPHGLTGMLCSLEQRGWVSEKPLLYSWLRNAFHRWKLASCLISGITPTHTREILIVGLWLFFSDLSC